MAAAIYYSFMRMLISLTGLVSVCKIQKYFHFQIRLVRLTNILKNNKSAAIFSFEYEYMKIISWYYLY